MTRYDLSDRDRRRLASRHRAVQAAIAAVANRKLGASEEGGIFKREGVVVVGGREIAIKRDHVRDDFRRGGESTAEERAVAEAIAEVADLVRRHGPEALAPYWPLTPAGDPLRAMLDLDVPSRPKVRPRLAGWLRSLPARLTAVLRPWPVSGR